MKKLTGLSLALAALLSLPAVAQMERQSAPEDARVYIVSPANGAVVPTTFTVIFGLSGMGVAPAGMDMDNTGHHHLLINGESTPDMDVSMGDEVIHFGLGQTETTVTLEPGEHTLQLILGDYLHIPHDPPVMSPVITVTVKE